MIKTISLLLFLQIIISNTMGNNLNDVLDDSLQTYIKAAEKDFAQIPQERKIELEKIAVFIQAKVKAGKSAQLTYICTHNSRRSHFGQIWAATAAAYYGIPNVKTFSGGTESTAFNERAVAACRRVGFDINQITKEKNATYEVKYAAGAEPIKAFSKKFSDLSNPQSDFCAIMTCSQADEACPVVKGAILRVAIPYEDPKAFDGKPEETAKYDERCKQIATETLYVFSKVKI
ncbi:MAG: protein-tyrosine-phosphatase [Emticicia sp.]|nr:protein-tyrosine-phosphatase [Emticicia sp.]